MSLLEHFLHLHSIGGGKRHKQRATNDWCSSKESLFDFDHFCRFSESMSNVECDASCNTTLSEAQSVTQKSYSEIPASFKNMGLITVVPQVMKLEPPINWYWSCFMLWFALVITVADVFPSRNPISFSITKRDSVPRPSTDAFRKWILDPSAQCYGGTYKQFHWSQIAGFLFVGEHKVQILMGSFWGQSEK